MYRPIIQMNFSERNSDLFDTHARTARTYNLLLLTNYLLFSLLDADAYIENLKINFRANSDLVPRSISSSRCRSTITLHKREYRKEISDYTNSNTYSSVRYQTCGLCLLKSTIVRHSTNISEVKIPFLFLSQKERDKVTTMNRIP